MESNPTTPTIAELWLEFEAHNEFIEERTFLLQQETDGDFDPYRESAAKDIVWRQGRIDALRAQLIERYEKAGFSIHASGSLNVPEFYGSADDADEYIACMSAVQWEARQREKEIQP